MGRRRNGRLLPAELPQEVTELLAQHPNPDRQGIFAEAFAIFNALGEDVRNDDEQPAGVREERRHEVVPVVDDPLAGEWDVGAMVEFLQENGHAAIEELADALARNRDPAKHASFDQALAILNVFDEEVVGVAAA